MNNIVRIISFNELKQYVLNNAGDEVRSTFLLRNPRAYRFFPVEEGGDENEMVITGKTYDIEGGNYLVSCWSYLGNQENPLKFWEIFKHRNEIAVVSTIERVEDIINKNLSAIKNCVSKCNSTAIHGKVTYYPYKEDGEHINNGQQDPDAIVFHKPEECNGKRYKDEEEYRFAVRISGNSNIDTYIFNLINPAKYIKKIWINPNNKESDKLRKEIRLCLSRCKTKVIGVSP